GIEPFGLQGYPGLHDVVRENDPNAATTPTAVDFYSPDTFNYNVLDVSADGKTLTVKSIGITATAQNSALEYGANGNTARQIFSFQVDAATPLNSIDHIIVIYQENWSFDGLYGSFPGANGIANASAASLDQLDRLNGLSLSTETGNNTYNNPSKTPNLPNQNPPVPLSGTQDLRFLTNPLDVNSPTLVNTLLPYSLTAAPLTLQTTDTTGDIVHRYWTEALQINGGANNKFVTWSDNPGLVMSHFDATNLPEGLLAQQYTMCDNFFHSAFGGSFLNHQFLVAAAPPVYPNAAALIPNNVTTLAADGSLALNGSGKIIRDQNITPIGGQVFNFPLGTTFDQNYAVNTIFSANLQSHGGNPTAATLLPSQNDTNPAGPFYHLTIGDLLDNAGISWKWYSGGWNNALDSSPSNPVTLGVPNTVDPLFQWHHQAFAFFEKYKPFDAAQPDGRNPVSAAHLQDEANFFADVANNTLPSVVFIKPLGPDNEHPGYAALQQGQQHVANIVAAVQANPALWAHTAIIVTYDEHGGRWDHVAPPIRDIWGPGVRVPAIVISPLAKRGYVDHAQYDTSSILKTIEQRFGLPSLNQRDANAPSLAGIFTNLQITRSGFNLNRRTASLLQTVTIKNVSSLPISGPIYLALDSLSGNTSLTNKSGLTATNAPIGSPDILVSNADLAAGASTNVTLQFANPTSGQVTYNARAVSGTSNP
ncbi:MAG: acid phosphatase, partial [Terrimicrobiaceae bacterium]|nr:acid phosphatase [Terrimicrobiaceae bacterium]